MSQDYRIKEYRFPAFTFVSGVTTATAEHQRFTDHAINGEILSVQWNTNTAGSIYMQVSGTSVEFFRRNAPSGAAWQEVYPRLFSTISTGSIAGALHVPYVVNEPLSVSCSVASGTTAMSGTSFTVAIRYR